MESEGLTYPELEEQFPTMKSSLVQGVFVEAPAYEPADSDVVEKFKAFAAKAKEFGIKLVHMLWHLLKLLITICGFE